MSVYDDFDIIWEHSHYWNWGPDWIVVKEVYEKVPTAYSVLMPFAYSYFEEMIRSTTSEYSCPLFDKNGNPVKIKVGMSLIKLAIKENEDNPEYVSLLEKAKKHFKVLDSYLIVQHNEPLTENEIAIIKVLVDVSNERYQSETTAISRLMDKSI